jgi:hypothetical protein
MPEAETATETPAKAKDSRVVVLNSVPQTLSHPVDTSDENLKKLATGKVKSQPRAEFIREMWKTGNYDRGAITRMCRAFGQDPEMKYQIVFQATKGQEGGPAPKAAAPATAPAEATA